MKQKYKLTDETIDFGGETLYRIEALRSFGNIEAGDKGGFVNSDMNLSQKGNCWIYDTAMAGDEARVSGDARISGEAKVWGNASVNGQAEVYGKAIVWGEARVHGEASVYGQAEVCGEAEVCGQAEVCGEVRVYGNAIIRSIQDYIVFKNWWSSGRYLTWTRSNNMWKVGCFYGTGEELIHKAYADSSESGKEYERVVRYVASILASK